MASTHQRPIPAAISAALQRAADAMREFDCQVADLARQDSAPQPKARTIADFKNELEERNQSIADWARENSFPMDLVYRVAQGYAIGRYGMARQIVKAMGLPLPDMPATAARKRRAA